MKSISIVLPAYNEEENIGQMIDHATSVAKKITTDYEIIVVNDGSKDNTKEVVLAKSASNSKVRLINQRNKGYGGAVYRGLKAARKEWVFFTDSDLQFDLSELKKFIKHTDNFDFIYGYRKNRADGAKRVLLAKMLKVWNLVFLGFPTYIKDIDCAFKLMNRKSFNSIGEIKSNGAMFTTEMILRVVNSGFEIKQIGVSHFDRLYGQSTGSNFKVILKAVKETFGLRKIMKKTKKLNQSLKLN